MSARAPTATDAQEGARGRGIAVLAVVLLAVAAHASSLQAGFVYDDHRFIVHNEALHAIDPVGYFTEAETTSAGDGITHDIYRPLRTLLFSVEYALFGLDPFGWHLVSVLLHALNAALLCLLLARYLGGHVVAAAVGAALFAVHPVTSESVAWVSSQGDLLALTFMLLALRVFQGTGTRATVGGCALFLLACFAKESALVLPGLVFLQALVLRGDRATSWLRVGRETWMRIGAMAALVIVYWAIRVAVVPTVRQIPYPGGFLGTLRGMLEGMAWYASMLVFPRGFSFDLQYEPPLAFGEPMVLAGLGVLLTCALAGIYGLATRRYRLAFVALGFLACLVPVSNVIVPLKTFIADRFLYPGLICLALGIAIGARHLAATWRAAVPYVAGGVVVFLVIFTFGRGRAWADEMTLWKAVRADRPTNANAYQGIAYELARDARISDAERAFRTYIAFNPIDGKAWMQLGDIFARVAASLDPSQEIAEGTNMLLRKKQGLVAQIRAYREALRIWDTFGLEIGRGSDVMLRGMFDRWLRAADQLGDVGEMKRVNDLRAAFFDKIDASDFDAFWGKARWVYKSTRFLIASKVFERAITERPVPREQLDLVLRARAAAFRDVGLDPGKSDEELRRPFVRFVEAQTKAAHAAGQAVRAQDYVAAASALRSPGIDDKRGALAMNALGLQRHPNHTLLLRQREILLK